MTDKDEDWGLDLSFFIDTDGYTDRDREMFVAGYEFCEVVRDLKAGRPIQRVIHTENASRIRMACGKYKRQCSISQHSGYAGSETYSELEVAGAE